MADQTVDTSKMGIGPAIVTYAGNNLGATSGGTQIEYSDDVKMGTIDSFGVTPVKAWNNGSKVTVKTKLVHVDRATLALICPSMTNSTGTINVGTNVGVSITPAELTIAPLDSTNDANLYTFYKVVPQITSAISLTAENLQDVEVTFTCLVDTSKATTANIGKIENSSASTPTVSSTSPLDEATGVAVDASITFTFSENVYADADKTYADHVVVYDVDTAAKVASITASFSAGTKVLTIGHADFENSVNIVVMVSGLRSSTNAVMASTAITFATVGA